MGSFAVPPDDLDAFELGQQTNLALDLVCWPAGVGASTVTNI
jgi:hypothetical protein